MASALGGFVGGLQQGYAFVDDIQRKNRDEARRDKEDSRRDQDQAFQQETQGRTRRGWDKEDQYTAEVDALNGSFFPAEHKPAPAPAIGMQQTPAASPATPAPPAAPAVAAAPDVTEAPAQPAAALAAPAPAIAAAPAAPPTATPAPAVAAPGAAASLAAPAFATPSLGMAAASDASTAPSAAASAPAAGLPPQPNKLTSMSDSLNYLIQRAQIDIRHGKTDGAGIANLYKLQHSAAKEGLNDAVQLLNQGDNEGAMKRFNETGDMKDWHVKSSVDGVFEHGGVKIPTKIVTVQAADGTTRTVNTAQTLVQNQLIDSIVTQSQKGVAMNDARDDARAGRKIQQQNADTQEQYRQDQADNMEEQRRLQRDGLAAKTQAAPIWAKEDDEFLKDQYSGKDEVTGAKTFDGEGMQFAKQVALARSRFNGGDATTASAYALTADANLKVQAKGDLGKLRQLRQQALQKLASAAPAPAAASPTGGPEWEARSAASRAAAPEREAARRDTILAELDQATDPVQIGRLQRELSRLGPVDAGAGTTAPASKSAPAPAPAPQPAAKPLFTVGGLSIADRDAQMATFNKTVGGGSARNRFESSQSARRADVAANFDTQLAAIKPGMSRAEAQKVLTWFGEQADAGILSNEQLKQLRAARVAARL